MDDFTSDHHTVFAVRKKSKETVKYVYTDHAGLEISVNLHIASPFSRHIAKANAGPKLHWRLWEQNKLFAVILLISLQCTNSKREKVVFWSICPYHDHYFLLRSTAHKEGPENLLQNIEWDNFDSSDDVQGMWRFYHNTVYDILTIMCPLKKYKQPEFVTPSLSPEIYRAMRERDTFIAAMNSQLLRYKTSYRCAGSTPEGRARSRLIEAPGEPPTGLG